MHCVLLQGGRQCISYHGVFDRNKAEDNMKNQPCSNCGAMASVVRSNYHFTEMGLPVELMRINVVKCSECGNEDPIIPNLDDLMHTLALMVICDPCKLSGPEVRFLRKYSGKSAEEFSRLLHVDHTHLSKVENGRTEIVRRLDKLVRFVVLTMSSELNDKADQLIELLPTISDECEDPHREIQIDPSTLQHSYA